MEALVCDLILILWYADLTFLPAERTFASWSTYYASVHKTGFPFVLRCWLAVTPACPCAARVPTYTACLSSIAWLQGGELLRNEIQM